MNEIRANELTLEERKRKVIKMRVCVTRVESIDIDRNIITFTWYVIPIRIWNLKYNIWLAAGGLGISVYIVHANVCNV